MAEQGTTFDASQVLMAMVEVADSLGHEVPWANAKDAWPVPGHQGETELRWAIEDMTQAGFIEATTAGLRLGLNCRRHPLAAPTHDRERQGTL